VRAGVCVCGGGCVVLLPAAARACCSAWLLLEGCEQGACTRWWCRGRPMHASGAHTGPRASHLTRTHTWRWSTSCLGWAWSGTRSGPWWWWSASGHGRSGPSRAAARRAGTARSRWRASAARARAWACTLAPWCAWAEGGERAAGTPAIGTPRKPAGTHTQAHTSALLILELGKYSLYSKLRSGSQMSSSHTCAGACERVWVVHAHAHARMHACMRACVHSGVHGHSGSSHPPAPLNGQALVWAGAPTLPGHAWLRARRTFFPRSSSMGREQKSISHTGEVGEEEVEGVTLDSAAPAEVEQHACRPAACTGGRRGAAGHSHGCCCCCCWWESGGCWGWRTDAAEAGAVRQRVPLPQLLLLAACSPTRPRAWRRAISDRPWSSRKDLRKRREWCFLLVARVCVQPHLSPTSDLRRGTELPPPRHPAALKLQSPNAPAEMIIVGVGGGPRAGRAERSKFCAVVHATSLPRRGPTVSVMRAVVNAISRFTHIFACCLDQPHICERAWPLTWPAAQSAPEGMRPRQLGAPQAQGRVAGRLESGRP